LIIGKKTQNEKANLQHGFHKIGSSEWICAVVKNQIIFALKMLKENQHSLSFKQQLKSICLAN